VQTSAPFSAILDTRDSPAAALQQVPVSGVTLTDTFWEPRRRVNRDETLPSQFKHLEETGAIDNFRRASGRKDHTATPFGGMWFSDSDVYKWLEAASWALAGGEAGGTLTALVDTAVAEIAAAQQPDGYLNTYFLFERAPERWATVGFGFNNMHELYCAGHLFQAAVAHVRATGSRVLLDVAARLADHVCDTFGPGESQRHGTDGHPEIEMALVELFRATGARHYLDQAQYFIDARIGMGRMNEAVYPMLPVREYARMEGHAVCGVYLAAGMTDLYAETGDTSLLKALDALWDNMTGAQMYVTGGIGPRWDNEAFGADFELPARAYAETCASIGSVMWNARMLTLAPDARLADLIERTLYNGVLSGLSLGGDEYFYQNPLADDGRHRRQAWFGCACCPPNVTRLLAQLPGYFYSAAPGNVYVHLYAAGRAALTLPDGPTVSLTQATDYPWAGHIRVTVEEVTVEAGTGGTAGKFTLNLRIPAWADGARLFVNGEEAPVPTPGTYAALDRDWAAGDAVTLALPLPARQVRADPRVSALSGRVALMRGPLVYCFEQADNPDADVRAVSLAADAHWESASVPGLPPSVVALRGEASQAVVLPGVPYPTSGDRAEAASGPATVTAIPYYTWANRAPGPMTVWVGAEPAPIPQVF